ncbi:MAG TPA: hypothetical protein VF824_08810 [Thermoanaerobaculia bacterium]
MADVRRLVAERVTWRMVAAAATFVMAGLLILYWASIERLWEIHPVRQRVAEHAGALLFVTGLLHALWELYGKRVFLEEVLVKIGVGDAARAMTVSGAVSDFKDLAVWQRLFERAKELDILVSYARTWRNQHLQELRAFVAKPGAQLRLILPDPDDPVVMATLAHRYATTADEVRSRVLETASEFRSLASAPTVRVWYVRAAPVYTWYRFDREGIFSFYNHQVDRSPVPALVVEQGGIFFTFATTDFKNLLDGKRVRPA